MSEAEPGTRDVLQSLPQVVESHPSLRLTRGQISKDVYCLIVVPEISFLSGQAEDLLFNIKEVDPHNEWSGWLPRLRLNFG